MLPAEIVSDLTSFGIAGLMGAMWLWERRTNRLREEQLTEAHSRILRDEQRLSKLIEVVEHNTAAMIRFTEIQNFVREVLNDVRKELRNGNKK